MGHEINGDDDGNPIKVDALGGGWRNLPPANVSGLTVLVCRGFYYFTQLTLLTDLFSYLLGSRNELCVFIHFILAPI